MMGIQRTCTLRKKTMALGPQYSSELGNTLMSMKGLQYWPAPNWPSSGVGVAQAEGGLARVDAGAEELELEDGHELRRARWGRSVLTPSRLWRTPAKTLPSVPYSFS